MLKFSRYFLFAVIGVIAPNSAKACDLGSLFGGIFCVGYVLPAVSALTEAGLNGVAAGFSGKTRSDIVNQDGSTDDRAKQVENELLASTIFFSLGAAANLAFLGAFLGIKTDAPEGETLRKNTLLATSMTAAVSNIIGMGLNIDAKSYTKGKQSYANNNNVDVMFGTSLASGISNVLGTALTWFVFLRKPDNS